MNRNLLSKLCRMLQHPPRQVAQAVVRSQSSRLRRRFLQKGKVCDEGHTALMVASSTSPGHSVLMAAENLRQGVAVKHARPRRSKSTTPAIIAQGMCGWQISAVGLLESF